MKISNILKILLIQIILISGCGHSSKTTLIIYSPHGKDLLDYFKEKFEAVHPDIDVQWLDMGSQDCLDRIRSERTNPQADIWWGAPSSLFEQAGKEGLLAIYAPSWKNSAPPEERSTQDYWYGTFLTPEVIAYNSTMLTHEQAPHDWYELIEPKWRDSLVIREPLASGTMRTIFCTLIQREAQRTGSIDSGFAWLQKLDANTKSYCADETQLYLKLTRHEASVTLWNMPDIMLQSQIHHYPFAFNIPTSGTPSLTDAIALVNGSKHEDAAKLFYEFTTSSASAIDAAQKFFRIPVRSDIDSTQLPSWMRVPIPRMNVDWAGVAANEKKWMQRWSDRVKTAK